MHGFVTLAAAVVLVVSPGLIPSAVGIRLDPGSYLVAYLLAGAETGLAVLWFGGSRVSDPQALRVLVWSCIAFHASTGTLEIYAFAEGVSAAIWANVAARVVIIAMFAAFRGTYCGAVQRRAMPRL